MKELIKSDRIKITPILSESEKNEFMKMDGFEVVGLFATNNESGPTINVGYPSIASYNKNMANMFSFDKNHGMYFLTGKFPESNDRPIYVINITDSLTVSSYSQTNASIIGEYDLLDVLEGKQKEANKKRA